MRHLEQCYCVLVVPQQDKELDPEWKATQQESFFTKKLSVEPNKVLIVDLHPGVNSFSHSGPVTKNSQTRASLGTRY